MFPKIGKELQIVGKDLDLINQFQNISTITTIPNQYTYKDPSRWINKFNKAKKMFMSMYKMYRYIITTI